MNSMRTVQVVLAAMGIAFSAQAQDLKSPIFYMWGDYPDGHSPTTTQVRKFIQVNLDDGKYQNPGPPPTGWLGWYYDHPEFAAEKVANMIVEDRASGRITDQTIAVILQNFGFDSTRCDGPQGDETAEANNGGSRRLGGARFFFHEDRVPGLHEWAGEAAPNFPVPRSAQSADRRSGDYGEARAYRHPFLLNALPDLPNGTVRAPLRQWMKSFCQALKAERAARANDAITGNEIPDPAGYAFYFDCEPILALAGTRNGVFMLEHLASQTAYWSNPNGDPTKYLYAYPDAQGNPMTLSAVYALAHAARSWPSAWQGASGLMSQLDPSQFRGAEASVNRDIMTFWYEVLDHSKCWILDNCMMSVLRAEFGPTVKCGNYEDITTDGQADNARSWMEDRDPAGGDPNADWPSWIETESLPRWTVSKPAGGAGYYLYGGRRWLAFPTRTAGTAHSPVCYSLSKYELCNLDAVQCYNDETGLQWCDDPVSNPADWPGHKRRRMYAERDANGIRPFEAYWDTTVRLHRSNIEAAIYSGNLNIVPWQKMPATAEGGTRPHPESPQLFTLPSETEEMMAMLRGKNIAEGLFWTSWNRQEYPADYDLYLGISWREMELLARRVYSTKVNRYTRQSGPSGPIPYTLHDPSRLEFTLPAPADPFTRDYEVEVKASHYWTDPEVYYYQYQTTLIVDFEWTAQATGIGPAESLLDNTAFDLNIECSTNTPTAKGEVYIWASNAWHPLSHGVQEEYEYYYHMDPSVRDQRTRARASFRQVGWNGAIWQDPSDQKYKTRLKLMQKTPPLQSGPGPTNFMTWYDLVQLIPAGYITSPGQGGMIGSISIADVNQDGISDDADVVQFLGEWLDDSAAADLDMNEVVEATDVETFVNSYIAGP